MLLNKRMMFIYFMFDSFRNSLSNENYMKTISRIFEKAKEERK